jgi:hypothetical protein
MAHFFYWSPGEESSNQSLGSDDHYLRLGEYIPMQEPVSANISEGGAAQGIFFYTSGKYALKATLAMHQSVDGPVNRTVQTGDFTYTNEDGDLSITTAKGGVKINAEESIHLSAKQETTDDATTITVNAGKKDVYYIQGKYEKTVDYYEEKMVEAHNHKTNIGLLINTHAGVGMTTSVTCEMTYSSFSVGFTAREISVKGIALSWETSKNSMIMASSLTYCLIEGKKVFLDEEFCVIKNETRLFRFTQGISKARQNQVEVRNLLAAGLTEAQIVTAMKRYDVVF